MIFSISQPLERRILMSLFAPDPTFGAQGVADAPATYALSSLADGKHIAVGLIHFPPDNGDDLDPGTGTEHVHLAVLDGSGNVENAFTVFGDHYFTQPNRVVVTGSRVYVSSAADDNFYSQFGSQLQSEELSAYTLNADQETTFGTNGIEPVPFKPINNDTEPAHYLISASLIGANAAGGLLVRAEVEYFGFSEDFSTFYQLVQLKTDGSVDTSFGDHGFVTLSDGSATFMMTSNGLLKLAVTAENNMQITRYHFDGLTLDTTFGNQGTLTLATGAQARLDLHEQPDGKLIAVFNSNGDNATYASRFQRLNANGSVDATFNQGNPISFPHDAILGVQFDAQSRVIVGTTTAFYRYINTGALDNAAFNGLTPPNGVISAQFTVDADDNVLIGADTFVQRLKTLTTATLGPDNILAVTGTGDADTITITGGANNLIDVNVDGDISHFAASDVAAIHIAGFANTDTISNQTSIPSTIEGGDGDDTLYGGSANDRLDGGTGSDSIWGNNGNDRIAGDEDHDYLYGNGGNDRIYGGLQPDFIRGNAGRDKLYGNGGSDRIYGGASADSLYAQGGDDQLFGEGGNDRLYGDYATGSSTLHGGAGDDILITANSLADQLFGDGGHDSATADAFDQLTSIEEPA